MPRTTVRQGVSILALACAVAALTLGPGLANAGAPAADRSAAAALPGGTWASIATLPDMNGIYEIVRGPAVAGGQRATPPVFTPAGAAQLKA